MTPSVTIYFPAHCGHTGSTDWGDVPQGRLWVDSRPRRLRPCGPVRSCGPVPFAVTGRTDRIAISIVSSAELTRSKKPKAYRHFVVATRGGVDSTEATSTENLSNFVQRLERLSAVFCTQHAKSNHRSLLTQKHDQQ